jgi:hypothetical protein
MSLEKKIEKWGVILELIMMVESVGNQSINT